MLYLLISVISSLQVFALGESRHTFRAPSSPLVHNYPAIHLNQNQYLNSCSGSLKLTSVAMLELKVEGASHCSNMALPALASSSKLTESESGRMGVLEIPADVFRKQSDVVIESNSKKHRDVIRISPRAGERSYSLRSCGGTLAVRPIQKVNVAVNDVRFCSRLSVGGKTYDLRPGFPGNAGDVSVSFEELHSNPIVKVFSWGGTFEDSYRFKRFNHARGAQDRRDDCSDEAIQAALDKVGHSSVYDRTWKKSYAYADFLRRSKKGNLMYQVYVPSRPGSRRLDQSFEVVTDATSCEVRSLKNITENDEQPGAR